MATDVIMPKMGESITEGTILEWKKQIGDKIERDETLLEISTDKVDSEIPSPDSGTIIEILYEVNQTVEVGTVIARIGDAGEKNESSKKIEERAEKEEIIEIEKPEKKIVPKPEIKEIKNTKRFYSPLVKAIAKENHISLAELTKIVGSGKSGRVNKNDIFSFLAVSGLVTQFGFQIFVNVGSTIGLIPTTGTTLPFISYGGSSMFSCALNLGVILGLTRIKYIDEFVQK